MNSTWKLTQFSLQNRKFPKKSSCKCNHWNYNIGDHPQKKSKMTPAWAELCDLDNVTSISGSHNEYVLTFGHPNVGGMKKCPSDR